MGMQCFTVGASLCHIVAPPSHLRFLSRSVAPFSFPERSPPSPLSPATELFLLLSFAPPNSPRLVTTSAYIIARIFLSPRAISSVAPFAGYIVVSLSFPCSIQPSFFSRPPPIVSSTLCRSRPLDFSIMLRSITLLYMIPTRVLFRL